MEHPPAMSVESYLRAAPKAELHLHLEGSIQPAMVLELARRNGRSLPSDSVEGLRRWFRYRDFPHFIEIYVAISECLRRSEDFELIVVGLAAELARQNARYAEVTFSPSTFARRGVPYEVYFPGLARGRERARVEHGVEINWVFDIVRDAGPVREGETHWADYTTGVAIDGMADGVVALGLAGKEEGNPAELFAPWFERAVAAGLHRTPHAGEHTGPESVRAALEALGAERIDHGVRAIEDPALVEELAARRIPLDLCPTSNLCLGVYPSLAAHPLRRLHDAGVAITINSDDPPLFNTTLTDEVLGLHSAFGLDVDAVDEVLLNAVRGSFLSPEPKAQVEASFRAEMAALRREHLPGGS